MGRGVRSNSDYCCVVLMGNQLADVLIRGKGVSYLGNSTREQYNLSKNLWDLLRSEKQEPSINDIFELADYSLNREIEWIEKSKECLTAIKYNTVPNIDDSTMRLRESFEQASMGQWKRAAELLDEIINAEKENKTKGFLMQIKAEYINLIDRSKSQQILKSARVFNTGVLIPIEGIQYDKLVSNREQAKAVISSFEKISPVPSNCIIHINTILDGLTFSPDSDQFESCLFELGAILGFESSRPDKENKKGPDNLWAIGSGKYFVIECKSGTSTGYISKKDCNQLIGSANWFDTEYSGNGFSCTPIMIHNSNIFDSVCSPLKQTRIMTPSNLDSFKKVIRAFTSALVQNENWQVEGKINMLLTTYKLRGQDIVAEYTSLFTVRSE